MKNDDTSGSKAVETGVSRRMFLGGGTLVAASALGLAAARAQAPLEAVGRPMPDLMFETPIEPGRRVGYAIVGLGDYALNQILPSFGECRYSRIAALVSGDREKAERVATQYGVDHANIYNYANYDEIADNDEIDVVYIITPPFLHADQSIRASRAGKHVVCEKPMAMDAAECFAMIEAAREADRLLMIGYRCHYEPYNLEAVRMIQDGELGTVRTIHTENAMAIDTASPGGEWRIQKAVAGGGSLFDIGIYGVNGARYLTQEEPVEVSANWYTPAEGFGDVEDVMTWQLRFPSGILAVGSTAFSMTTNRFGVSGTQGSIDFEPATDYYERNLRVRTEEGVHDIVLPPHPIHFALQLDHTARAILDGTQTNSPGEDGMQDVRLMKAMYASAADGGRPVTIDWAYGAAP